MTRNKFGAALVVALTLSLLAGCGGSEADTTASTAQALDMTPCFDAISTLRAETLVVQFTLQKDQDGLVVKLDEATQKLQLGKSADAVQKLMDYSNKVQQLILGGKIAPSIDGSVTPQLLVDGAAAAIACIQPPVI